MTAVFRLGRMTAISALVGSVCIAITAPSATASETAAGHRYSVKAGTTLTVPTPGLLSGAADTIGGNPSSNSITYPTHGTLNINSNGSFTFTANKGYTGQDSFTYEVCDTSTYHCSSPATVTIRITGTPPTIDNTTYTVQPGTALTVPAPGLLAGASRPNGDLVTISAITYPNHGSLNIDGNGSFTLTAPPGYTGQNSFTIKACDSTTGLCSPAATVTIRITAPNPAVQDQTYVVQLGATLLVKAPGLLRRAKAPQSHTLQVTLITYPTKGDLKLDQDGAFVYVPFSPTFVGPDSFTYQACDTTTYLCSDPARVSITVGQPPVIVAPKDSQPYRRPPGFPPLQGQRLSDADAERFWPGA